MFRASVSMAVLILTLVAGAAFVPAYGFGAIAYNPRTGAWGYSFGYDDLSQAEAKARSECGQGYSIVEWVDYTCGALAADPDNPGYFATSTGWRTQFDAEESALWDCGPECLPVMWVCDD